LEGSLSELIGIGFAFFHPAGNIPYMNSKGNTSPKENSSSDQRRIDFRPREHYQLLAKAAKHAGLSINGWLVNVTLDAARRELGLK
jgi:hypothetical protein